MEVSGRGGDEEFRRLLWFLLGGTRGGENRAKILNAIKTRPSNLNQLAKLIGVDYRSVQHHIAVLQKNNLVQSSGVRYGVVYSLHQYLSYHYATFEQVCLQLGYSKNFDSVKDIVTRRRTVAPIPQTGLAADGLRL